MDLGSFGMRIDNVEYSDKKRRTASAGNKYENENAMRKEGEVKSEENSRKSKEDENLKIEEKGGSTYWIECGKCRIRLKRIKKNLGCKCKEIHFCSWDCRESSEHFQKCEEREVVHLPMDKLIDDKKKKERSEKDGYVAPFVRGDEFVKKQYESREQALKAAEEGKDPDAAYHIGIFFSHRTGKMDFQENMSLLEKGRVKALQMLQMPEKFFAESRAVTDRLALKYFELAARGGLAVGMVALSRQMFSSKIIETDPRVALYWLTKAVETDPEALVKTDWDNLAENQVLSVDFQLMKVDNMVKALQRKPNIKFMCPNLSGLLFVTNAAKIIKWKGKTFNGGTFWPFSAFKQAFGKASPQARKNIRESIIVGRAGASYDLTSEVSERRAVNNTRFKQGQKGLPSSGAVLDLEQVHKEHTDAWYTKERSQYLMTCRHLENEKEMVGKCADCQMDAVRRVEAVAEGQFSISIEFHVPRRYFAARFFNTGNVLTMDLFKKYSQPEVCCVLQCLMTNPADLHPLHLADDPNLFWPLVWYYGSVHHAILQCCGEKTAKKVYGLHSKYLSRISKVLAADISNNNTIFPADTEGEVVITCGYDVCPKLRGKEDKFVTCQGCKVRKYCNRECAKEDWPIHQSECSKLHLKPTTSTNSMISPSAMKTHMTSKKFPGLKKGFLL